MTLAAHQVRRAQSHDALALFYRDYAGSDDKLTPVICLHGLTRNSRDFEDLAPHIARSRRVLALDFRGRGYSEYDPDFRNYIPPTYATDTLSVLDHANIQQAIIIGTSLGGLVAMLLAKNHRHRLAGVVLNDIGPELAPEGLARIQGYTGKLPPVTDWAQASAQLKQIFASAWPGLDEKTWLRLAHRSYRENAEGVPSLDMDPLIGRAIREVPLDLGDPWELFTSLQTIPTLLLRGAHSDLLAQTTVDKAKVSNPKLRVVQIPNRGHVPLLDEPASLQALDNFLSDIP
ncbi:MAG: alpha/beta fold hydrolase [Lysobacterales bacterium]